MSVGDDFYALCIDYSGVLYAGGGGAPDPLFGQLSTPFISWSTDYGDTWDILYQFMDLDPGDYVSSIASDPNDFNKLYLTISGTSSNPRVFKSLDGGVTWSDISPPTDRWLGYAWLIHHPKRSGCLYLKVKDWDTWKVLQSLDFGNAWTDISSGLSSTIPLERLAFNLNPTSNYPRYLYLSSDNGVCRLDLRPFAPQNVAVANYNNNPRVTWTTNPEIDLQANPYKVYRKITDLGGGVIQDWTVIAAVSGSAYIDYTIAVLPKPYQYTVWYKITAVDLGGSESYFSNEASMNVHDLLWKNGRSLEKPTSFSLSQNNPNPFNSSTVINYQVPENSHVSIRVYDMLGREVARLVDDFKEAGYYQARLHSAALSSGVYIYRMVAGKFVETKKLQVLK